MHGDLPFVVVWKVHRALLLQNPQAFLLNLFYYQAVYDNIDIVFLLFVK